MEALSTEELNEINNQSFSDQSNQIQNLENNLLVTSFNESLENLKSKENSNSYNYSLIEKLAKKQQLNDLLVPKNSEDYIYQQYLNAQKIFRGDLKVSKISFGLSKLFNNIYLYIKKEDELSLNYMRNYNNIHPVDFDQYVEDLSSSSDDVEKKSHISFNKSELFKDAGPNLGGYSFEFNIKYFLNLLSNLIELPNLIFDLSKCHQEKGFFHELDISFYNEKNNLIPKDTKLLRTNCYVLIKKDGSLEYDDKKDFELFNKSLILGEVKSKFPKKIRSNSKIDNVQDIIDGLFFKLRLFYELYKNMKIYKEVKHIQLIFFYDYILLKDMNQKILTNLIKKNYYLVSNLIKQNKIKIHFYIVFTLPSITTFSINNLSNEIKTLKNKMNEMDEVIKDLRAQLSNNNKENCNKNESPKDNLINQEDLFDQIFGEKDLTQNPENNKDFKNIIVEPEMANIKHINTTFDLLNDAFPETNKNEDKKIEEGNINNIFPESKDNNKDILTINNNDDLKYNDIINDIFLRENPYIKQNCNEIQNKFNDFIELKKAQQFKKLNPIPPHNNLNEDQLKILNEFFDTLSENELNIICFFVCNCQFCGNCRLKLALNKNYK